MGLEARLDEKEFVKKESLTLIGGLENIRDGIGKDGYNPNSTSLKLVELYNASANRIFEYALDIYRQKHGDEPFNAALIFIGGYARNDPSFASDVDMRWVSADNMTQFEADVAKSFNHLFLEISAKINKSVYNGKVKQRAPIHNTFKFGELEEPQQVDSYIQSRFICGNSTVHSEFIAGFFEEVDRIKTVKDIFDWYDSVSVQHDRNFIDLKDSVGGLRYDNISSWLYLMFKGGGVGSHLRYFANKGIITENEKEEYKEALSVLKGLRHLLHAGYSRGLPYHSNLELLTPETARFVSKFQYLCVLQDYVSKYSLKTKSSEEIVMAAARKATEIVSKFSRIFVNYIHEKEPTKIGEFEIKKNRIYLDDGRLNPINAMKAYALAAKYGLGISTSLKRSLSKQSQHFEIEDGDLLEVAKAFESIFSGKYITRTLDAMVKSETLFGYLPSTIDGFNFKNEGRKKLPHSKTVIQQSLDGIAMLEIIRDSDDKSDDTIRELKEIYLSLGKSAESIFLALLFRDTGVSKDNPWKGHLQVGADKFRELAYRNRFQQAGINVEESARLMEIHNRLYDRATLDIAFDFASLKELADEIGTVEQLKRLYLYTVADTMAKFDKPRSVLDANQITNLYHNLRYILEGNAGSLEKFLALKIDDVVKSLGRDSDFEDFLEKSPFDFLLSLGPGQYKLFHKAYRLLTSTKEKERVNVELLPRDGYTEICITSDDRVGLLADITEMLFAAGYNILTTDIHTLQFGSRARVYDRILVAGEVDATLKPRLTDVLLGNRSSDFFLSDYHREYLKGIRFKGKVSHSSQESYEALLFRVKRDEPGQLTAIARFISDMNLSISSLKSNVWSGGNKNMLHVTRGKEDMPEEEVSKLEEKLTKRFIIKEEAE